MDISNIVAQQRKFFQSSQTKDISFRIKQLKKLRAILKSNEEALYEAIYKDMKKSKFDTYASELAMVYQEINVAIKNIKLWSKTYRVKTNFANFPAKSYIIPEPLGNTLVISPWNYPYQLSLIPAISAIAAGNTVILKPSELPANASFIIAELINDNFSSSFFHVMEGGIKETTQLLDQKFDKIFFTGSTRVGKIVYQAAAKHLTPVTLELGGKSPALVLPDCNLKMTVKRLIWAKYFNAGQTCIAPDYVLVHRSIEKAFLDLVRKEIIKTYRNECEISENYVQIINEKNFNRLTSLLDKNKIYFGGKSNKETRIISPTVMHGISFDDKIMEEEIFGPILPVIVFDDLNEAILRVKEREKPLACYVYSQSRKTIKKINQEISFGGGAVNDSVMHFSNSNLPFGGIGNSGIGAYHNEEGFKTFTHFKSILDKPSWFEAPFKYAPYSKIKLRIIKWLME